MHEARPCAVPPSTAPPPPKADHLAAGPAPFESLGSTPTASPRGDPLPAQQSLSPRGASTASIEPVVQRSSAPLPVPPLNLNAKLTPPAFRSVSVQDRSTRAVGRPPMLTPAQTFQQGFQAALQLEASGSSQPQLWQQTSFGGSSPFPPSVPRFSSTVIHSTGPQPASVMPGVYNGSALPPHGSVQPNPAWQTAWPEAGAPPTTPQQPSVHGQGAVMQPGGVAMPPTSSGTGDGTHRSILSTSTHSTVLMDGRPAHARGYFRTNTAPAHTTAAGGWAQTLHASPAPAPLGNSSYSPGYRPGYRHTAASGSMSVNPDAGDADSTEAVRVGEAREEDREEDALSSAVLEDLEAVWANHQKLHLMVQTLKGVHNIVSVDLMPPRAFGRARCRRRWVQQRRWGLVMPRRRTGGQMPSAAQRSRISRLRR